MTNNVHKNDKNNENGNGGGGVAYMWIPVL